MALQLSRIVPSFANLPAEAIGILLPSVSIEDIPAKTIVLQEGHVPESLCVLVDGLVQMYASFDEGEATICVLHPVSSFATDAVLRNSILLTSARTVQACRIVRIDARTVRRLVDESHEFARAIVSDLTLSQQNMVRELKSMRLKNGFQRLVAWIVAMQAEAKAPSEIELPYDKSLLAARLGMTPETLSRDLARLAEFGVTVCGRRLRISDTNTLSQSAAIGELNRPTVP